MIRLSQSLGKILGPVQTRHGDCHGHPEIAADGMINTTVSFEEPGEYILWGRGDDGGLYHDAFMTVTVTE